MNQQETPKIVSLKKDDTKGLLRSKSSNILSRSKPTG